MRSLIPALILPACLLATLPAAAAPVVYEYSGAVTTILEYEWLPGNVVADTSVASTDLTPAPVALGDTFRGRFVYDSALPAGEQTAQVGYYGSGWVAAPASLVGFDAGPWQFTSLPLMPDHAVFNDFTYESYGPVDSLLVLPRSADEAAGSLILAFDDDSAGTFGDTALPATIDLNRFNNSVMQFSLYDAGRERGAIVLGSITGLSLVSAVPEPSSWVLALAGLITIGWTARRRRPA